jgi:hypothetical protein
VAQLVERYAPQNVEWQPDRDRDLDNAVRALPRLTTAASVRLNELYRQLRELGQL